MLDLGQEVFIIRVTFPNRMKGLYMYILYIYIYIHFWCTYFCMYVYGPYILILDSKAQD